MLRFSFRKAAIICVAAFLLPACASAATDLQSDGRQHKGLSVCWSLGRGIDEARAQWGLDIAKKEGIGRLRVYDSAPTPGRFLHIAKERGVRVTMGAWLDLDKEENARQLRMLRKAIIDGLVEPIAIIGSEALSFNKVSPDELVELIERNKRLLPEHVAVTTAELFGVLIENPRLIDAQRHIVGLHHYPFADAVHIDHALQDLIEHYTQLKALSGNKRVVVFETGWPSGGNRKGQAIPSIENQKRYNREVASWAQKNGVDVYFFQLIDEPWKTQFIGNTYEAHWGLRREDGSSKH